MPVLSMTKAKTWHNPSPRRYGLRHFETHDPYEIAEVITALEEEVAQCAMCQRGEPMTPRHATTYYRDGIAVTYWCRSGSRHYDHKTKTMVGSAHCTCDGCY
jgi:hypothetical protein